MVEIEKLNPVRESQGGLPPRESDLRAELLQRLEKAGVSQLTVLQDMLAKFGLPINLPALKASSQNIIQSAQRSNRWAGGRSSDGHLLVGYYRTAAQYFALFGHEFSHCILSGNNFQHGYNMQQYNEEEGFCWDFSETFSRMLNLPYDRNIEFLYRLSISLRSEGGSLTPEEFSQRLEQLIELERVYRGFSEEGSDSFCFLPDGTPRLY